MILKKRILVAPLNWGLGHATRCIPIINALLKYGFEPVIASDGKALELLIKEFPEVTAIELPSYKITYVKKAKLFKVKLLQNSPKILKAIKAEKILINQIIKDYNISGVISDNRLGLYSKRVPCVFISHQLNVLSGNTTWISTRLHQKFIKNFDECWVPDFEDEPNLSGKLGHGNTFGIPLKYIGPISRFNKKEQEINYKVMVLLSGPEPQRSLLEKNLISAFKSYPHKVLFVRGIIEEKQHVVRENLLTIYNYMTSNELEKSINESELVVSRSGYTTIMDLAKLEKKAFFIPTPGQYEQEYLASSLEKQMVTPFSNQDEFDLKKLNTIEKYQGLTNRECDVDFKKLFSLF